MALWHTLELHAREREGLPAEWSIYAVSCVPPGPVVYCYEIKGMVAPLTDEGNHDWKRGDETTDRTLHIGTTEHNEWVKAWHERTGICPECMGKGDVIRSYSKATGVVQKPCPLCVDVTEPASLSIPG